MLSLRSDVPGLRLDNHYAYQKHFIRGIRSEAERDAVCLCVYPLSVSVCVCILEGVYVSVYMQVTLQEQE